MSSANLVTGTEGIIVLPSGMEVNVESFSLQRTDAEEDTTAVQETQQNSAQTTFRYHGEVQGELVGGGNVLGPALPGYFMNVGMLLIVDPASPFGQYQGTWNLQHCKTAVTNRGNSTITKFTANFVSQNVTCGPKS